MAQVARPFPQRIRGGTWAELYPVQGLAPLLAFETPHPSTFHASWLHSGAQLKGTLDQSLSLRSLLQRIYHMFSTGLACYLALDLLTTVLLLPFGLRVLFLDKV